MIEKSELLRIPAFEGLPDDQLDWFISQSDGGTFSRREIFTCSRATPAVSMIVVLEGQMQVRGDIRRRSGVLSASQPGAITGLLPFSRNEGSR